jgi:transposase
MAKAIDLAKTIFQVYGVTKQNKTVLNKSLSRTKSPEFTIQQAPCKVVMKACYSSHYWARQFESMGHQVTPLPAQHVTPFVSGIWHCRSSRT